MANTFLRDSTRKLRKDGSSLNEITRKLRVPKSTVRYWCRDIVLTKSQQKRLFKKQKLSGVLAAEKIRRQRILFTKKLFTEGKREIGALSPRELLLTGTALYWAEGYRKGDGEFGFTNSDPKMIRFIIKWLQTACSIPKEQIHLRICVNEDYRKRMPELQKFWSRITGIPASNFSKPTLIRVQNKKVYANAIGYFGTLRIKVRQSTNLRRKIMGWIQGIADNAGD